MNIIYCPASVLSLLEISQKRIKIMIRYLSTLVIAISISFTSFAQKDSSEPVYLRFPTIPQFTIYKASDSSAFTKNNLKKKKSTVFIIFSPDCEHCQRETDSLIAHIRLFRNAQIIMTTYLAHDMMVKFYRQYKIANHPEITMGRDAKFFFPVFFKVASLPAIYVYDKKGKFKKSFEGSVKMSALAAAL